MHVVFYKKDDVDCYSVYTSCKGKKIACLVSCHCLGDIDYVNYNLVEYLRQHYVN